jgi:hypothetical protein
MIRLSFAVAILPKAIAAGRAVNKQDRPCARVLDAL